MQNFFKRAFLSFSEKKIEKKNVEFHVSDVYTNLTQNDEPKPENPKIYQKILNFFKTEINLTILYLALLGMITSTLSMGIDWTIDNVEKTRLFLSSLTNFYFLNFLIWVVYTLTFAIFSVACVYYISEYSSGSGVPEMKSMIGGVIMDRYLSFMNLVAKTLGLICAYGAGLYIGREGPLCHIGGMVAYLIMKIGIFDKIAKNDSERRSMLAASTAAGVSSVFGAPFGGVIFSIELTSTFFPVQSLWKSLFTALCSSILFSIWRFFGIKGNHQYSQFQEHAFEPYEYVFYGLEGIVLGLLGAFFVYGSIRIYKFVNRSSLFKNKPFQTVCLLTLVTAFVSFNVDPGLKMSQNKLLGFLYNLPLDDWGVKNPFIHLVILSLGKYFLTMAAVIMPIPAGIFTPIFIAGACLGRLFGEILAFIFKFLGGTHINALGYSVVGAASLASGVTRTLSTSVIMFEITGQIRFLVPALISTIMALTVGNIFNKSFYAEIALIEGIPNPELPHLKIKGSKQEAKDIMRKNIDSIPKECHIKDLSEIIKSKHEYYPIINNLNEKILLGNVPLKSIDLVDFLKKEKVLFIGKDESKPELENEIVDYIEFDSSPFIIFEQTPIEKIHHLFSVLGLSYSYVVNQGKLTGLLSKKELMKNKRL